MKPHLRARVGLFALLLSISAAAGIEPKRVLLIHSFGRDFAPFNTFSGNFRTELARQFPTPVDFYEVSLESARYDEVTQEGPFLNYLGTQFTSRRLDLLVTIGGPAAQFAQRHRQRLFPDTPLLIAAADRRLVKPAAPGTNEVAAVVIIQASAVLEGILQVLPQTTNVVVVIGHSPVEQFWTSELRLEFEAFSSRVGLTWMNETPFDTVLRQSAALPARSAILYAMLAVDAAGVPHLEDQALTRLHEAAKAPIFGLHDSQLGRGIVGGPLMEIETLSRRTAQAAKQLLLGANPANIQVAPQGPGKPKYDWRELRTWGISERRLPPDSAVLFRQPSAWSLYGGRIMAGAGLCVLEGGLIAWLVASLARRRRAERALRESEERLSLAAAAANVGVWAWDISGGMVWGTDIWRRMFGFPPQATLYYEEVLQRIHPDDRSGVASAVEAAVKDQTEYAGEYRVVLPDGSQHWMAARGRVDGPRGAQARRMLGASVDITGRRKAEENARRLSGRLIKAQEEERARLARELHDDVTQRLARLAIEVGRCELGADRHSQTETARAVREGLAQLSEDVHALSYRLHPSVLEDLGLVEALKAECERFSHQESIVAKLRLGGISDPIPQEAALCLFRVAQEALRNTARHAHARQVEVCLRSADQGVELAVKDDGRGFHASEQRDSPSLGLSSMRERVHLAGGEWDVDSAPGAGTTVVAWVPTQKR